MSEEKTRRDRAQYAAMQLQGLFHLPPHPGAAKYKREWPKDDPAGLPDLARGIPVVVRVVDRNSVIGHVLARVLDWGVENSFWTVRTTIYVVVEKSSSEKTDFLVGRIIGHNWEGAEYRRYGGYGFRTGIVSFDPADFKDMHRAAA